MSKELPLRTRLVLRVGAEFSSRGLFLEDVARLVLDAAVVERVP